MKEREKGKEKREKRKKKERKKSLRQGVRITSVYSAQCSGLSLKASRMMTEV